MVRYNNFGQKWNSTQLNYLIMKNWLSDYVCYGDSFTLHANVTILPCGVSGIANIKCLGLFDNLSDTV